jgi:hypothetical protein
MEMLSRMICFGICVPSQVLFSVELMYCLLRVNLHVNRVDPQMCYTLNYIILWAGFLLLLVNNAVF